VGSTAGTIASVQSDASVAYDIDDDPLQYRWDYNNDGTWDTAWSSDPHPSFTLDDDRSGTSKVEVSDGNFIVSATVSVSGNNAAPVVNTGDDATIFLGQPFTLSAGFTDPGVSDMPWDFAIDWGGSSTIMTGSSIIQGANTIIADHQYTSAGIDTITVTVTDKDGESGVDSLQLEVKMLQVKIDVKPGSDINSITPDSSGVIQVAILTENGFDASRVDASTVRFGPAEATPVHYAMEDVDGDNDNDMILHFETEEVGLDEQDKEVVLNGKTVEGIYFTGTDTVRIVPLDDKPESNGKADAPGQNKEPGDSADGKGKDDAPG
jgi:hypothetical protein